MSAAIHSCKGHAGPCPFNEGGIECVQRTGAAILEWGWYRTTEHWLGGRYECELSGQRVAGRWPQAVHGLYDHNTFI